jgi:hypothetical protein
MKALIKSMSYFLLPLFVTITIFWLWIIIISKSVLECSLQFKLPQNKSILFAGDSHIVGAIPDTLYLNSINIGLRSESYYHTYHKLKYFIEKHQIHKIYLGYSYHNLSSYYDSFIDGSFSSQISTRLFFILPFKEKMRVLLWNKKKAFKFIRDLNKISKLLKLNITDSKSNFIDGFDTYHNNTTFSEKACAYRINEQFYYHGKISDFSNLNLIYLNAIIDMCNKKEIELTLLTTPLHKRYIQEVPKVYISEFLKFTKKNKSINLENTLLTDSCYSPDGDHINNKAISETNKVFKSKI